MTDQDHASSELDRARLALSVPVLTDDVSLRGALDRIATLGREAVPACTAASITLIERGRAVTMGSSDVIAFELDAAQYAEDDGPCLAAARQKHLVTVEDTSTDERWPRFGAASDRVGVRSSISLPLWLGHELLDGGFNVYAKDPAAFDADDVQLGMAFANQATAVVLNAHAYWAASELSRNLTAAMATRAVIEQAKGVLMGTLGIDADDAFEHLRTRSQARNVKLNVVAMEIAAGASANPAR